MCTLPVRCGEATRSRGASGATFPAVGVASLEVTEGSLSPASFRLCTTKLYACPFVSPCTMMGEDAPCAMCPSGTDVTTKSLTATVSSSGGVKRTVTCALPATTRIEDGGSGAARGAEHTLPIGNDKVGEEGQGESGVQRGRRGNTGVARRVAMGEVAKQRRSYLQRQQRCHRRSG